MTERMSVVRLRIHRKRVGCFRAGTLVSDNLRQIEHCNIFSKYPKCCKMAPRVGVVSAQLFYGFIYAHADAEITDNCACRVSRVDHTSRSSNLDDVRSV
jgi:hypothetical protein